MKDNSIRHWKRNAELRGSKLEWVQQIPCHWKVEKLKYLASVRASNVDKKSVEGQRGVRLCNYLDVYKNEYITANMNFMEATATPEQIRTFAVRKGDVIITKDSESWDDIAVPAYVSDDLQGVVCGYHLAHVRPKPDVVHGEYLARCFAARGICEQFKVAANGVTRFGLDTNSIETSLFPLPPIREQEQIVRVLRRQTTKIDALVAKKRRLIELLEEKRTALISHAVTKGLDPNVRMKDSGIQGLGQIPVHWNKVAAKRVVSFITSGSRGWAEYYSDEGDLFIQSGNLDRKLGLDLSNVQRVVPPHGAEVARTQVVRNDVLVCVTGAYTGNVGVVECDLPRAYVNQHVALVRPSRSVVCPKFLALVLASSLGQWHFKVSQYGGTKQGLGLDDVMSAVLFMPPKDEQERIVSYLDNRTREMERLVVAVRKAIHRLHEYRTALISAAVTGKIDVRGEVDV